MPGKVVDVKALYAHILEAEDFQTWRMHPKARKLCQPSVERKAQDLEVLQVAPRSQCLKMMASVTLLARKDGEDTDMNSTSRALTVSPAPRVKDVSATNESKYSGTWHRFALAASPSSRLCKDAAIGGSGALSL